MFSLCAFFFKFLPSKGFWGCFCAHKQQQISEMFWFFSHFQGLTGPIGPPGPSGPNGEKVSFIYFHTGVGELKHCNVISQTSGCQLIRLLCFFTG